jgi:hypothetical protein
MSNLMKGKQIPLINDKDLTAEKAVRNRRGSILFFPRLVIATFLGSNNKMMIKGIDN